MSIRIDQIAKGEKKKSSVFVFLQKDISFSVQVISDKKKYNLFSELHMLIDAGVDVKNALDIMAQSEKSKDAQLYKELSQALLKGDALSQALTVQKGMSAYDVHTIALGEETGKLAKVSEEIAKFYERKIELKRQMSSAFVYPIFVLLVTLGIVFFMLYYVVPMFEDMFQSFDSELPALTQKIIAVSHWFQSNVLFLFAGLLVAIAFFFQQRKKTWLRKLSAAIALRTGPLAKLLKKIYLTRFCQSMKLLVESDTPLNRAIHLSAQMINFYPYEKALEKIEGEVVKGISLNEALLPFHSLFGNKFISLVKVSEEYNQLDKVFGKLSEQYQAEVDIQSKIFSKILEPLLMIIIAFIVGVILLSMYMPLFEISNVIA
ncbi:MAG: type II secretion system F family protein [Bacteroidota bacterium]